MGSAMLAFVMELLAALVVLVLVRAVALVSKQKYIAERDSSAIW